MKKQRILHISSAIFQSGAVLIAWHWLPPYLIHNPGLQILAAVFILHEFGHAVFHGK